MDSLEFYEVAKKTKEVCDQVSFFFFPFLAESPSAVGTSELRETSQAEREKYQKEGGGGLRHRC